MLRVRMQRSTGTVALVPDRQVSDGAVRPMPEARAVEGALASQGNALEPETRASMERRLGHDFSQIRIHADGVAAGSARVLGARAFTVGRDIVFGSGQYAPGTQAGRMVLAHE